MDFGELVGSNLFTLETQIHRAEQIIIRPVNATPYVRNGQAFGTVFDKDFLKSVLDLQTKVTQVRAFSEALGREVELKDICYKPLEPASHECGVFSPLEYFQSNATLLDAVVRQSDGYMQATAVVITILVKNSVDHDSSTVLMARAWESEFIRAVLNWRAAHPEVVVAFAAERSVEDEIVRQSHSDISTIVISYTIMVVYVSICLGNYRGLRTCLIDLKLSLSIGGVSIVLASVFSSIGLWSYLGVPATLIIIEVIPFLVLAVGVDNIFIMVQDFLMHEEEEVDDDDDEDEDGDFGSRESVANDANDVVEKGVSSSGGVGGCVGGMVRKQGRGRQRRRRQPQPQPQQQRRDDDGGGGGGGGGGDISGVGKRQADRAPVEARIAKTMGRVLHHQLFSPRHPIGILHCLSQLTTPLEMVMPSETRKTAPTEVRPLAHVLAPFILSKWVRAILFILFVGWMCFCIAIIPDGIHIGLDQKLSMSLDSYVLEYFEAISSLLAVGPPVYFVVTEGHSFDSVNGQNQICSRPGCDADSLRPKTSSSSLCFHPQAGLGKLRQFQAFRLCAVVGVIFLPVQLDYPMTEKLSPP
ncbi:NPC intracellular cholesterol transporter 1 [Taenia crassiceps]|uniref:NPC intracellular cholesterol transporter 1 n=1 Tax=Taenia crassiceps TaxID=6207 RepID=A0ABR4Q3X1_9CEST